MSQNQILELWKSFDADSYDNPIDRAQAFQSVLKDSLGEMSLGEVSAIISRLPAQKDLADMEDPEKLKQKVEDSLPQIRQDPEMVKALKKKGVSPEQFEKIARDPKFQGGLNDLASRIKMPPRQMPPCNRCGTKSKASKAHNGIPFCSDKCRKLYLKS